MTHGTSSDRRSAATPRASATPRVLAALAALTLAGLAFIGCGDDEPPTVQLNPYPEPAPAYLLMSVWGTGPQDVFAVGQPGVILHYDGVWTLDTVPDTMLTSVWGTSSSDVYACGHHGAIWHFDGAAWRRESSGTTADLFDIGRGPYGEVHAVGRNGTILRRTGGAWSQDGTRAYRYGPTGVPTDTLVFNVEGATATRITPFAIGGLNAVVLMENDHPEYDHRWLWGNFEDPQYGLITAANAASDVPDNYMANDNGKIYYLTQNLDGVREWKQMRQPNGVQALPSTYPEAVSGLWLDAANSKLYIATPYGKVATLSRDGTQTSTVLSTSGWFTDVWGSSGTDIFVTGYHGVLYHFDGNNWTRMAVPVPENAGKALPPTDASGWSVD